MSSPNKLFRRLIGCFKDFIDSKPEVYSRTNDAYKLLNENELKSVIKEVFKNENGKYIYDSDTLKSEVFLTILNKQNFNQKTYEVFNPLINKEHKRDLILRFLGEFTRETYGRVSSLNKVIREISEK